MFQLAPAPLKSTRQATTYSVGCGYDRETTPVVKVRRSSIWEDYTKDNATAVAKIDGVGTISPIISSTFMGDSWVTRAGGYPD